jgi:hypothetical protein
VMVRRQLIGVRDRVEGRPITPAGWRGFRWQRPQPTSTPA